MHWSAARLVDLRDPGVLRDLLREPESDLLERKRDADGTTLAKVVSAFANTAGGWLILGIEDDGTIVGWQPKGRAHARDWLRDVLDNHLNPLPHFEADVFPVDRRSVGIVRVPRSPTAPHFLATGEVFERRNGQTTRVSSARVRELMLRDAGSREAAVARLSDRIDLHELSDLLDAPRKGTAMHARAIASIVRVSVLDLAPSYTRWVHDPDALVASDAFVKSAPTRINARGLDLFDPPNHTPARTTAGGHTARATWDGRIMNEVIVAWDRIGICGVRLAGSRTGDAPHMLLSDEVRDEWLVTQLHYLIESLRVAGAIGPAVIRWDLYGVRGSNVITVRAPNVVAASGAIPPHYNNMLALDIDADSADAPEELAAELWTQLERLAGARPTGA